MTDCIITVLRSRFKAHLTTTSKTSLKTKSRDILTCLRSKMAITYKTRRHLSSWPRSRPSSTRNSSSRVKLRNHNKSKTTLRILCQPLQTHIKGQLKIQKMRIIILVIKVSRDCSWSLTIIFSLGSRTTCIRCKNKMRVLIRKFGMLRFRTKTSWSKTW